MSTAHREYLILGFTDVQHRAQGLSAIISRHHASLQDVEIMVQLVA